MECITIISMIIFTVAGMFLMSDAFRTPAICVMIACSIWQLIYVMLINKEK